MSLIALYVYSPTTFESDSPIEAEADAALGPAASAVPGAKLVTLEPGIYRVQGGATLRAMPPGAPSALPSYEVVALGDTKTNWPDPSLRAMKQFNKTSSQIRQFLGPQGERDVLPGSDADDDDKP